MDAAMREYMDDAQGEALTRAETARDFPTEGEPLATITDEVTPKEWDTSTPVLSTGDGAESEAPRDPVREVDRRNGNAARARKQAAKPPSVVEDEDGNVHRLKAVSLVIPEEKRCVAMTVHGERCKVGRMRGLEVCVFHAHRALSDDSLADIATDPDVVRPRLSPRKALKAVVALRAEELAMVAVGSALSESGGAATRAVLALVDAVDPLMTEAGSVTLSREGAESATWSQMRQIFNPEG
jgi:hypothetical protein